MKNDKELTEEQMQTVQGGRASGRAPTNDMQDAGSFFWGNLSGDIRPEPEPNGAIAPKRMENPEVEERGV